MSRWLQSIESAAQLLARGEVLLFPTDTVPGLHARGDLSGVLSRLTALKGRTSPQPFLFLVASVNEALALGGAVDPRAQRLAAKCWPGPFTFVLPGRSTAPVAMLGPGGTVAVRVPDHPELNQLLRLNDFPLASTSANLAGREPCRDWEEAVGCFQGKVDGIVDTQVCSWTPSVGKASALVDLTRWPPRLLRAGPVPLPTSGDRD
jgi:L-threonylcarbamoyladenylate synthase